MLSAFAPWCADECISAFESQSKKPHQAVAPQNLAQHQGIAWSNSTVALGLRSLAVENRVRSRCTGKERDSESGLDNFGARYDSSQYGRFMTPDPSNLSVDFWIPQTWNRYSYALNNPLQIVDRNGLWPTSIHNEIINKAFPGMSTQDLKTLQQASYDTDHNPVNGVDSQDSSLSYIHGMSDGMSLQNPQQAEQMGDAFIAQNEHDAKQIQAAWIASGHTGIAPAALTAFGNALHTITDRTSPAHKGNQPWFGIGNAQALAHAARERSNNGTQMKDATSAARSAFLDTFGFMDLMFATQPKQEVVTHRFIDCSRDNTQPGCQ